MKGKLFIAGLALLALAACNKEDGNVTVDPNADGQYIAVNLAMTGNPATKAWKADDFKDASTDELAVSDALFLFFNGNTQCADPFDASDLTSENAWTDVSTTDHGQDDAKSKVIIVLNNPSAIPTSIVAILNASDAQKTKAKASTLSGLAEIILEEKEENSDFVDTKGNFLMSNSVYVNNNEVVIGTPVTEENVCKERDAAEKNPVQIHVERVRAKVDLTIGEDIVNGKDAEITKEGETTATPIVDSEKKQIKVNIKGFWLDNTNPKASLVKNLTATILPGTWWNDMANFRSYWATSVAVGEGNALVNGKYSDMVAPGKGIYVNENTPKAADVKTDTDDSSNSAATQIVFATELSVDGVAAGTDIVKYLSVYYTMANWETYIIGSLSKYYIQTGNETDGYVRESIKAENLTFGAPQVNTGDTNDKKILNPDFDDEAADADANANAYAKGKYIEDWEAVIDVTLKLKDGESLVDKDGKPLTFGKNNVKKYKVQYFNGGKSYFYAPIRHNDELVDANKAPQDGYYGIVRNHLYQVTATDIIGLGTPVANPDKIIIPVKPKDTNCYIAAEIHILKYKVVANDYVLE